MRLPIIQSKFFMRRFNLLVWVLLCCGLSALQAQAITGTVTDLSGEPLIGASLLVEGTSTGVVTDLDGNFSITVPANAEALVVTYTGFSTQRVPLIAGTTNYSIELRESATALNEIVVTGYGTQTRRRLTTSIASVGSEALENVPVTTFEGALQGRLPGVTINGNAGTLGSQTSIRVRGIGSINSDNQPLFVVDGVIINSNLEGSALGGPGTSPLTNINPNDIESIDVLKDAASASVYGSRGSNGVVIITTKSGKFGQKARVSVSQQMGIVEPTAIYDLLNGQEYAQLWNQSLEGRGIDPINSGFGFPNPEDEPSTDWIDEVTRTGSFSETFGSVSGGTDNLAYYIGGTYRNEDGYVLSTNLKRYSFRMNLEQKLGNKWRVGLNLNPTRTVNTRQNEDNNVASPLTYAALAFPNVEARDENGETRGGIIANSVGRTQFAGTPLANIEGQNITLIQNQVISNAFVSFSPIDRLTIRSSFGTQFLTARDNQRAAGFTTDGFGSRGTGSAQFQEVLNYTWDNTITYGMTFGNSELDLTGVFSVNDEQQTGFSVAGNNFADDRLQTLNSAAEITGGGGTLTRFRFVGYFLSADYSLNNNLFIRASARVDGSSRFGSENLYGFFPAISAAYDFAGRFNELPFSQLKLRASYGQTGNAGIGNFASRGLVGFGADYNGIPGGVLTGVPNNQLTWETAATTDVAIDFELKNGILGGSVGYYNKQSSDLLLNVPQPLSNGIASTTVNAGTLVNRGIEFSLDLNVINKPDMQLSFNINGATVTNEVTELIDNDGDGESDDIINGRQLIREGEAIGSWYMVEYAGVDPENGDALFVNGEGETTSAFPGADRQIFGNPLPDFTGGFGGNFRYKGFDASFQFQAALGHQLYLSEGRFVETAFAGGTWNQLRTMLDAWTPENTDSQIPQARLFLGNGNQHSTRYLDDADYLRLRNIQVGYTFDNLGSTSSSIRVFFSGQNLLTFTDFKGLDPEASGNDNNSFQSGNIFFSRPQNRVISGGLNLNF